MTTPSAENTNKTSIKHIVISSGGPAGHMMYSILRTLNLKGIWNFKDVKSIYGSSIGSYIAIILSLNYDWSVIDDYLIKRPWEKIFVRGSISNANTNAGGSAGANGNTSEGDSSTSTFADAKNKFEHIFRFYKNHGLYGVKEFTETLRPVLQGKDMSVNITMREFYEKTGIELHFFVTEINKFCVIDFSYKTHPNQSLVEACYMSCCYPFGFTPIYRDGCCYLDGGIINDYPVNECICDQKCNVSEVLGIKMLWERKPANLTVNSSVLQFVSTFFNQIKSAFFENRVTRAIPNEVVCVSKVFSAQDWMNWVKDENYRRELVLRGETFANVFLSYRRNYHESFGNIIDTKIQSNNRHETVTSVEPTVIHHDDSTFVDNTTPNVELEPAPAVEPQPDDESVSTNVPLLTKNSTFDVHNIDEPTMV
jgi:predicted acylesterase/phospholipase RssA